jgi:vacuolar-type H+-ATPase subunit I/STV1
MLIKLDTDGQTIISFNYNNAAQGFDVRVDDVSILDDKKRTKYKFLNGKMVELTLDEKKNHPITKLNKQNKRIEKLRAKIRELRELNEIKDSTDLTNAEKTEIASRIAAKNAETIDDSEDN